LGKDKNETKSIREVELHPDAQHLLDDILAYAKKTNLSPAKEIKDSFYNCFDAGDQFADQLNKRGVEDRRAQLYALTFVKNNLGRKVTKPKYGVFFVPVNLRDNVSVDEKTNQRKRTVSAFGQCMIVNLKNKEEYDEKFATIKAYDNDCPKIENLEIGKTFYLEASGQSISADVLNLTVDDRCVYAKETERRLSDIEELQTSIFDITPICDAPERASEGTYGDYRLIEGFINFITFPKNKTYAKMELTDTSVSLEELEKKKNQANLTCLINADMVSGIGRESIVRFLGRINVKDDPEWGLQVTLFFPVMAYPMLVNAPEVVEVAPSEEVADATDYFSKSKAPVEDTKAYDKFFDGDKDGDKSNKAEDDTEIDEEEQPATESDTPEEVEDDKQEEPEVVEEEKADTEESVPEDEEDPYAITKGHECVESGDFGSPDGIIKGQRNFNNGCYQCSKKAPEIYELCVRKSKE